MEEEACDQEVRKESLQKTLFSLVDCLEDLEAEDLETESLKRDKCQHIPLRESVCSQGYAHSSLKIIIVDNKYFSMWLLVQREKS